MNFNSIQFTQSPTTPQLPIGGSKKLMKIVNYFLTNLVTFHAYSTSIHASILFFIQNYCFWLTCQIVLAETNFIWLIMSTSFYKCLNLLETWRGQDSLDFFSWTFSSKLPNYCLKFRLLHLYHLVLYLFLSIFRWSCQFVSQTNYCA